MFAGLDERFGDVLAHRAASLRGGLVSVAMSDLGDYDEQGQIGGLHQQWQLVLFG